MYKLILLQLLIRHSILHFTQQLEAWFLLEIT